MHVPSVDDCPECNKEQGKQFPYKMQYDDGRSQQPIHVNRLVRRHTSVHDQLGKKIDPGKQLEVEANAWISVEPFARDPEVQRVHNYASEDPDQWCPGGLTRSQKRRLQRLRD